MTSPWRSYREAVIRSSPSFPRVSRNSLPRLSYTRVKRRSLLGCNEHRLYAVLHNRATSDHRLYVLHRKVNSSNRLVVVRSLHLLYCRASYVPVGSKIYVLNALDAFSIDCGSHAKQAISEIPERIMHEGAHMVGGKIYVIGDGLFHVREEGGGLVGRVEEGSLGVTTKQHVFVGPLWFYDAVVMEDKIYMKGQTKSESFVYRPNDSKWEIDRQLNSKEWEHACVVEDVLYYLDLSAKVLRAYDPKQKSWNVVNGLEDFLAAETVHACWSKTVNYGAKKLALFFPIYPDATETICCAEIALERRQGGDIWGKMQWCDVVFDDGIFDVVKCVAVTV